MSVLSYMKIKLCMYLVPAMLECHKIESVEMVGHGKLKNPGSKRKTSLSDLYSGCFFFVVVQSVENMRNLLHTPLTCETLWKEERNALNLFSWLRTFCARVIFLSATVCSHNVLDLMYSN